MQTYQINLTLSEIENIERALMIYRNHQLAQYKAESNEDVKASMVEDINEANKNTDSTIEKLNNA
jgi:hypothetical protein